MLLWLVYSTIIAEVLFLVGVIGFLVTLRRIVRKESNLKIRTKSNTGSDDGSVSPANEGGGARAGAGQGSSPDSRRRDFPKGALGSMGLLVILGVISAVLAAVFFPDLSHRVGASGLAQAVLLLLLPMVRKDNNEVNCDNDKSDKVENSPSIHRNLFPSSYSPQKHHHGQDTRKNIKSQQIHSSVPVSLANFAAIAKNTTVMPTPITNVSQGTLPEAVGTNTPTTNEPNNIFAPSRKKSDTVFNSLLDNIQFYSNLFLDLVKGFLCYRSTYLNFLSLVFFSGGLGKNPIPLRRWGRVKKV